MPISIKKGIKFFSYDQTNLALHFWIPSKVKSVIFYIHGTQSHGGWLFETGMYLALSNIAVFVLDRRGSGLSEGLRGDIPAAGILFDDYVNVLTWIRESYNNVPLILYGQSLGGSILVGLLSTSIFRIHYDALVFCAPGLSQKSSRLLQAEYDAVLENRRLDLCDVGLLDEDYTKDEFYLSFIRNDPLCLRKITCRARAILLEIETLYHSKDGLFKHVPSVFIYPMEDPIINSDVALNTFKKLSDNSGIVLNLPAKQHYLEFSEQRKNLLNWLSHYALTSGYMR